MSTTVRDLGDSDSDGDLEYDETAVEVGPVADSEGKGRGAKRQAPKPKKPAKKKKKAGGAPRLLSLRRFPSTPAVDFCGEELVVTKQEHLAYQQREAGGIGRGKGGRRVVGAAEADGGAGRGSLVGKKKMSTMEKSRHDWGNFKSKQDEATRDEMDRFAKDGYLAKQARGTS
ncbi:hypothetical protein EMIHUDRAFT_225234 [Emiliania huxleyi CCMP1516]|uniref:BCNT-C domain-containing protein n=2 Tax=Emiliania huxleyi TaxID=2903 RepID=A0A0D3KPH3_EMIH1|nr:hypothetical protein EMIHUDRAFT_225234 [Emiliania huxleyi CCMP1516]EOD37658.1 hypothetical protein EMIHUDRAFT_225234 [Emiliania huxleyi CCMP1516]|eukprot:XP_005790087.1 hypothetical protein EMIHUDRAFT_225234 [Emiliania huxleyi CCMP1516]